jgi:glycosyltransferase involved in cell wall biosynthesis
VPKVSLIVAAYNVEMYIERCLRSIINQTFGDIEIIVVNDGSIDNTLEIANNLSKEDSRIKIFDKDNEGLINARKSGLSIATGDYILFIDGDDWIKENAAEKLYNKAIEEKADLVLFNLFITSDEKKLPTKSINHSFDTELDIMENSLLCKILPSMCSKLIKLNFLKINNIDFPDNITYAEDLATTITLITNKPRISILKESLYFYYQRKNSITKEVNNKILDIPKVVNYIENVLKKKGQFEKYKEEFNYLVYTHVFFNTIICAKKYVSLHSLLNKDWRKRRININKNKYYIETKRKSNLGMKIKMDIFNLNFKFGIIYEYSRRFFKTILSFS